RSRDAIVICEKFKEGVDVASYMRCSMEESMCRDAIVVNDMFNRGVEILLLYIRSSTEESMCRDAIGVHEMFKRGVKMISLHMRSSTEELMWTFNESKLFSRTFNDSKLFSKTFNDFKLFSRTFNTSKLFFGFLKKCRVCKLQALDWKAKAMKKETMSWLRRCAEFKEAAQSDDWVEMLVLYCWRSVDEDFRVAREINKLCDETSEFLKETQAKDDESLRQLEALARETEAMARKKCIFIEKLKRNWPF
nr:hypothetical protein [Tanacetum cinerariifolium]